MNLHEKLVALGSSVDGLAKANKGYQYSFVSSSQVLQSIRKKMYELNILLVPRITQKTFHEKNVIGTKEHFTELEMVFTWVNAEKTDEIIECPWYGQGADAGEKGVGKALTYAEKYFLLKFFNIPTDKDDPDNFQEKSIKSSVSAKISSGKINNLIMACRGHPDAEAKLKQEFNIQSFADVLEKDWIQIKKRLLEIKKGDK